MLLILGLGRQSQEISEVYWPCPVSKETYGISENAHRGEICGQGDDKLCTMNNAESTQLPERGDQSSVS